MRKGLIFVMVTTVFLVACDSFTTTVDVDDSGYVDQMVVGAILSSEDFNTEVYVGKNRSFLDSGPFQDYNLSGAEVVVEKISTGEVIEVSESDDTQTNYDMVNPGGNFYEPGSYNFTVNHPSYPSSVTTLEFPESSSIENMEFELEGGSDIDGNPVSRISFDFQDDASEENYYAFELEIDDRRTWVETLDASAIQGSDYRELIISDESFNGQKKRMRLTFSPWQVNDGEEHTLSIKWSSVNEGYYLLGKTVRQQQNAIDNPFASAVQVFSNVNDALGVIGFTSVTRDTLRI